MPARQSSAGDATFNGTRTWGEAFYKIPAEDWERVDWNDTFWTTGILRYQRREYGRSDIVTVRHFNVRFEPYSVHAIFKATAAPAAIDSHSGAAPESKGPPVSPAHLQAWFEFYKKIGGDMREDAAQAHARMCFPKNSVWFRARRFAIYSLIALWDVQKRTELKFPIRRLYHQGRRLFLRTTQIYQ